ncbi:unnamed protein product, partial [marine sediment metagenome]
MLSRKTGRKNSITRSGSYSRYFISHQAHTQAGPAHEDSSFKLILGYHLIAAFHATLSEIEDADLLINVLDVSHAKLEEENRATYSVLKQLKAENKPTINVLNKIDLVNNGYLLSRYRRAFDSSIVISALQGQGLDQLLDKIAQILDKERVYSEF